MLVEGFKFYRKDRDFDIKEEDITDHDENSNSSGGGSIIYCKEHIKVELVKRFSKLAPDSLTVNINTNSGKMYIVCVYRSQNLSNSLNSALLSSLKDVCKESNLFFNRQIIAYLCKRKLFLIERCSFWGTTRLCFGPLLFVLFVNDLPDSVKNVTKLFADDLKLIADASDKVSIENDLSSLEEWESLWLLKFNPKKCKVMHLDYNYNPNNEFKLDGIILESIVTEKDLGLTMSHDLKWDSNIKLCIKDANRAICWISRNPN